MVLVNGVETGFVSAADRGFAYGDGVFRTLPVRNGIPEHWSRHRAKLLADCAALGISPPQQDILEREVMRACQAEPQCALKIVVTRGISERGYRYEPGAAPTRVVLTAPLPAYPPAYAEDGVRIRLCRLKIAHQPATAGVKHLNRLENVLARAEWSDAAIAEGIVQDVDENVIGGTMTNVFIGRGGALATPVLDLCGVAGVARERIIAAAARRATACDVTMLSWKDVVMADEIFLVNSLVGVWPVRAIDGETRCPGPLARAARSWLDHDHDEKGA